MKMILVSIILLCVSGIAETQEAPITFAVVDTLDQSYAPGFKFKGSWDTLDPHSYDATWADGHLYKLYDDGDSAHGDEVAGDHVWSALLNMVPDGGTNTWEWGVTDTAGNWIDGNWQFQVVDATPDTLTYVLPVGTSIDVTVTFSVYMGLLSPAAYQGGVSVQGDMPPLDWTGGSTPLADPEPDSIYTVDVLFPAGSEFWVQYKYTSNDGGSWNWEGFMGNRFFRLDDSSPTQVLPIDYYNRDADPSSRDVTVTFIYNCGAVGGQIESGVWLVGSRAPLAWGTPDLSNPLDSMGNWIYERDVTFPAGTNRNVEFKAIMDADINGWDEAEFTGMNRDFLIDDTDSVQVLDTLYYDNQVPVTAVWEGGTDVHASHALRIWGYPNPFQKATLVCYSLNETSRVKLEIYNMTGRLVTTLADGLRARGSHRVLWDGTETSGKAVSAGVYFCRLEGAGSVGSTKLLIMR